MASGYVSHVVYSYVFVSGLDPDRVSREDIADNRVFSGFTWRLLASTREGVASTGRWGDPIAPVAR
jgi:hypothetical protein